MRRHCLFAYGTLLDDRTVNRLLGAVPASQPAKLLNFRCFQLASRPYPGIRYAPGSSVDGRVLDSLTEAQLKRLDQYEGSEYRRQRVQVCLRDGRRRSAWTYVIRRLPPPPLKRFRSTPD